MKIGLEVHVELNTETKLFCSCKRNTDHPNTATCPICLGHPGTRPQLNKKAVQYAIQTAESLNFDLHEALEFSRKNYFYPDLSKNYQITQYKKPVGENGEIQVDDKKITLKRIHLEEDPASTHYPETLTNSTYTLLDYNRAGTPLLEIVTTPTITTPSEARSFLNELADLLTYLNIFNPENSNIKADANISIKETGYERIEIKNITGFKAIEQALHYEKTRQKALLRRGRTVKRATRTWDAASKTTKPMREKETEAEYGYITEPDLPQKKLTQQYISRHVKSLPELPQQRIQRYTDQYGVPRHTAKILTQNQSLTEFFEKTAQQTSPVLTANWIRREIIKILNNQDKDIHETQLTPEKLATVLTLLDHNEIGEKTAQHLTKKLCEEQFGIEAYIDENDLRQLSSTNKIQSIVENVVNQNEGAVQDYHEGETKALNYLIGQVMKETKGRADPDTTRKIVLQTISQE